MRKIFCFGAALVLALPAFAGASDLRVSYLVDDVALKAAVPSTSLSFQLYSDSACTVASGAPASILIDDVSLVSKLKAEKKGTAKPPKAAELIHTMTGVTLAPSLYLKVTGTGITPVSGACQLQLVNDVQLDALPSGKTIRGVFHIESTAAAIGSQSGTGISYIFNLASPPTINYLPPGSPSTVACPGTPTAPEAAPGNLCVYENFRLNILSFAAFSYAPNAGFEIETMAAASGGSFTLGSWAVTAP